MSVPIETIIDDDALALSSGFYWRRTEGLSVLVSQALEDNGFVNGFSTRLGGVSAFPEGDLNLSGFNEDEAENIYENRRRFLGAFQPGLELACVWQVHGDLIKIVTERSDIGDSEEKADGVVSDIQHVLAAVKTADCVPILIGDPKTRAFAAVHAGWRGTVQGIVAKAVGIMVESHAADPRNLIAATGPAAGCEKYEVGSEVIDQFTAQDAENSRYFTPTCDRHALVDLHSANRDQLLAAGLAGSNIFTAPYCTMDRPDLFFSYRLEKARYGKTGRLLSVIGRAN